jgi:MerC mercury resistance protein
MRDALLSIRNRMDRLGILLSSLCALHCILGIVLVAGFGLGGELFLSPAFHRAGLALAVLVGIVTLGLGALRHGAVGPLAIGGIGIAFMSAGLAVSHGFPEAALTIAGVALVAAAHIRNLRHTA